MRTMLRSDLLIISAIIFILLTGVAMLVYPGGTFDDENAGRYSMSKNFFSDLGATRAYDGQLNIFSMVLFILGMVIIGLAFSLFTLNYKAVCEKKGRFISLGKVSIPFGVLCGLSFISVAASPVNLYPDAHMYTQRIAFIFLLIYLVMVVIAQIANGWSLAFTSINIFYLALLLSYIGLLFAGPGIDTSSGLETQAIAQKVIIYSTIANMLIQAYGIRRYVVTRYTTDMI